MTRETTPNPRDIVTSDLATATWLAVVQTYNECTASLSQNLSQLGLSLLEHEILMNLLRSDGMTQRELSQRCFSAKSGISVLVSRFEENGLISRRRSIEDRRAWNLTLTSKGRAMAEEAQSVQATIVRAMAQPFSDAELALVKARMEDAANELKILRGQREQ